MSSRVLVRCLVALLSLVLVAGCSGDDDSSGAGSGTASSEALPTQDELAAYFGAVAAYDPDLLAEAEQIAADGSPAQDYAGYLGAYAASAIAGGQPVAPAEAEPVDGGFTACGGTGAPDECVTWADLAGADGRLTDFSVDDVPLEDALVSLADQPEVSPDGLFTVQPQYAYRSPQSGSLFVLVAVTAVDIPLEVQPRRAIYVEQDALLSGVEGRGPTTVEPGTTVSVILPFPDAGDIALDGQVTLDVTVGGAPQSVGFGLADPPAA